MLTKKRSPFVTNFRRMLVGFVTHWRLLIALSLCFSACVDSPSAHNSSRTLALYSWQPRGKAWHYVFVLDEINRSQDAIEIVHSPGVAVGEAALKKRLSSFAAGRIIAWRDKPPQYVLKYPPLQIRREVSRFAKQNHLQIQILPTAD